MGPLGMPTSMFLIFLATVLAGSLGAIHYLIVHVLFGKPFDEELEASPRHVGRVRKPPAPASAEDGRG